MIKKIQQRKGHSEATKRKISKANTGKVRSIEMRKKYSEGHKGKKPKNLKYLHSLPKTEKWKTAIKKGRKDKMPKGKNHWNWKGGKTNEIYPVNWTETLKRSIRERDKYVCQLCSALQSGRALDVHHIDYNKQNCNPDNLITLCMYCNLKVNHNRSYWTNYFQILIKKYYEKI